MQLNISVDMLVNLVKDNPSEWAIFFLGIIATALLAVLSLIGKTIWIKYSQPRKEDAFVLGTFHGYLTGFVNLHDSYRQNPYSYMGNRLEDKMETISHNITYLVSRSELKIDSSILARLKSIANDYDTFAHRIKTLGENDDEDELSKMHQETLKIKGLLEKKLK